MHAPEPDSGGGSSDQTPGDAFNKGAGANVQVNITDMHDYAKALFGMSNTFASTSIRALTPMGRFAAHACPPGSSAGTFSELQIAMEMQQQHASDMQHFFKDLGEGIRNISSASQVIADLYQGKDSESAMTLNDLAFAFADPGATRPKGAAKSLGKTWLDVEMEQQEQQGEAGSAAQNAANGSGVDPSTYNSDPTSPYYDPTMVYSQNSTLSIDDKGRSVYTYSDGSKVVYDSVSTYQNGQWVRSTTTIVYGTDGKAVSNQQIVNSKQSDTGPGTVTVTDRDENSKATGSQETVTNKDGSQTIITKDDKGKTVGDPVQVQAPNDRPTKQDDTGPMQQQIEQSHSYGGEDDQKKYGTGY